MDLRWGGRSDFWMLHLYFCSSRAWIGTVAGGSRETFLQRNGRCRYIALLQVVAVLVWRRCFLDSRGCCRFCALGRRLLFWLLSHGFSLVDVGPEVSSIYARRLENPILLVVPVRKRRRSLRRFCFMVSFWPGCRCKKMTHCLCACRMAYLHHWIAWYDLLVRCRC